MLFLLLTLKKVIILKMLASTNSLIDFKRHDLLARASTSRGCMSVFPPGKKARQRVAVGDSTGAVVVFSVGKHHDVQIQYETPTGPKPVSRVTLFEDQLFFTTGHKVSAYSKKGKLFFGFESNLTETVRTFQVETPFMLAGGEYVVTAFQEVNEIGYYMAPDRVNDMVMRRHKGAKDEETTLQNFHSYLGCADRTLRTVVNNQSTAESACEASITAVGFCADPNGKRKDVTYGTSAGSIGAFTITKTDELARRYSLVPDSRMGTVTALGASDINLDGAADVILGREDGHVEVHALSLNADGTAPLRMWVSNIGEYVTSLGTGLITQLEQDEIIVSTFSGKVVSFALTDEDADVQKIIPSVLSRQAEELPTVDKVIEAAKVEEKKAAAAAIAAARNAEKQQPAPAPSASASATTTTAKEDKKSGVTVEQGKAALRVEEKKEPQGPSSLEITHAKVLEVQAELQKIRGLAEAKKMEYAVSTNTSDVHKVKAVTSEFKVIDSFSLDGAAGLMLAIEADIAIDFVGIQCDVPLEVLDSESMVIMSQQSVHPGLRSTALLFMLRPAEDKPTRVHATLRSHEGQAGTIRAYVVCKSQPRTAQTRNFTIHPLSLHHRIAESEVDWSNVPLSSITIQGNFTIRDMHGWILSCLPEVPDVLPANATNNALFFKNTFQGTVLSVRYAKGEAELNSDSLTTLSILKEFLTKEATNRKVQIRMQSNAKKESAHRHLQLLHPMISYQASLTSKLKLVEALKEIESQEQDAAFLSTEYKQILANAQKLEEEVKLQPKRMEYLKKILRQLFLDKGMFFGENNSSQAKLNALEGLIDGGCNEKAIESFFGFGGAEL